MKVKMILSSALLSAFVGIFCGLSSAIFLHGLDVVTSIREGHRWLFILLPMAGLLIANLYLRWGKTAGRGNDLVIDEFHHPRDVVPLRMAPMILCATWMTHLFGGSAGREGTAVQMGAAIADQFTKSNWKKWIPDRRVLLLAGMSGGFGSVFGVPLAGAIFGVEVLTAGHFYLWALLECLVASSVAHLTASSLGVQHTAYPLLSWYAPDFRNVCIVAVAGVAFALAARFFIFGLRQTTKQLSKFIRDPGKRAFFIGALLAMIFLFVPHADRYAGLGVSVMQEAVAKPVFQFDWIFKIIATIFTLGAGFKGGEVTPLLFIGATLGNFLSTWADLPLPLLSSVGFVAVFAGASRTPLACTIMAAEIFGLNILPYALLACFVSAWLSGNDGLYHTQRPRKRLLPSVSFRRSEFDP